jgi:two-component system sensor histidine kinase EvgS
MAAGMDDCLFKPLRLPQLEALLQRIPRRMASVAALETLVDLHSLQELAQNDNALLLRLLKTTRDENIRDLEQVNMLYAEKSWGALARSFHRLAGAAQIIGATRVEGLCRQLEQDCEGDPREDDIAARVKSATDAVAELNKAIELFIAKTEKRDS